MTSDLLALADELYAAPLSEFTPLRDAAAKRLKSEGDAELSAAAKRLKKPSVAAWVLNLLVRREAEQVDQVLTVGAALRQAAAALDGDELRTLTKQRRQVTAAVTTVARRVALGEGVKVTPAVADQVEATLTAAMLDEGAAAAVRSGLLVAALAAAGVDAVDVDAAVALPDALGHHATPYSPPAPDLRSVPDPGPEEDDDARAEARAAAEAELAAAEAALAEAEGTLGLVADRLEGAKARSLQVQAELDELRRRVAELESAAEEADEELAAAEADHYRADKERAAAEQRRTTAAEQLSTL